MSDKLVAGLIALIISAGFAHAALTESERIKAKVLSAPLPDYPYEARRTHTVGRGLAVLEIDPATGAVTHAYMVQSTGSSLLDDNTLSTFRHWKFQPGTVSKVKLPINYTMTGEVVTNIHVDAKPMDKMLAPFLGKGTVVNAPMPQYPRSVPWTEKHGEGLYELSVGPNGDAVKAKVLRPSGDSIFDETTVAALQNWRLRRGPMIIELPLTFHLTATKYSVGIPKHP